MVDVVVVEDEVLVGAALQRELRLMRISVRVVNDPLEADSVIELEQPRALISDYYMPSRSGIDVLAVARERFPSIRRCLFSGSLSQLREDELRRIEPCVLMSKPWSKDDLERLFRP